MNSLIGAPTQEVIRRVVVRNALIQKIHFKVVARSKWYEREREIGDTSLRRDEVLAGRITELIASMEKDSVLTILSPVTVMNGERAHIPMLDFKIPLQEENSRLLITSLEEGVADGKMPEGVLLETERSYHYYGYTLLTDDKWRRFMAESLVYTPAGAHLVDCRWVGWRLLYGAAALRLNEKNPGLGVPRVLCEISK